jgi:serine/threonine-protein kinase HipA
MRGKVYFQDRLAGIIEKTDTDYRFSYLREYLETDDAKPISQTLPLSRQPYIDKNMIPFFDGLIPEGWLLDVATETWKIDSRDRMRLLLTVCQDCIGAVKIIADE